MSTIRKTVKPAHPGARIPDPAHPGLDLPDDGAEVAWTTDWILRERRGEIVVLDASADIEAPSTDPEPTAA